MKNILTENPAPVFMEFNPNLYQKAGIYDKWINFLSEFYNGYVFVQETLRNNQIVVYPIEKLWEFQNYPTQIGHIFLIHKLNEVTA